MTWLYTDTWSVSQYIHMHKIVQRLEIKLQQVSSQHSGQMRLTSSCWYWILHMMSARLARWQSLGCPSQGGGAGTGAPVQDEKVTFPVISLSSWCWCYALDPRKTYSYTGKTSMFIQPINSSNNQSIHNQFEITNILLVQHLNVVSVFL